jgi:PiT family inorganic phosphate transporter
MADPRNIGKPTLDKDLDKFTQVEEARSVAVRGLAVPGAGLVFLALAAAVAAVASTDQPQFAAIVIAAAVGGYMALNIGANDVGNNVGPAVGARALPLAGALVLAAIFESAGALIAGDTVVATIASGIIDATALARPDLMITTMLAALLSAALWINLATWIGAPVSTTHSIVGAVMGAGIASAGLAAVNWIVMGSIVASWMLSPVLGGVIAAATLAIIKETMIYRDDKIAAARFWLPLLVGLMGGSFAAFLVTKGLGRLVALEGWHVAIVGIGAAVLSWRVSSWRVRRQSRGMENRNSSLRALFALPLVIASILLSFAHGANDVANAVGPLAAIVHAAQGGDIGPLVAVPFWVMVIGSFGISFGIIAFGPKLIRMIGKEITRLNPMRAFSVALSTAVTVLVASALGLPVSSTHTAVGAVFGVGFFREWYTANSRRRRAYLERRRGPTPESVTPARRSEGARMTVKSKRRRLVRRAHVSTILAAWVTTVPAVALLSGLVFLALNAMA